MTDVSMEIGMSHFVAARHRRDRGRRPHMRNMRAAGRIPGVEVIRLPSQQRSSRRTIEASTASHRYGAAAAARRGRAGRSNAKWACGLSIAARRAEPPSPPGFGQNPLTGQEERPARRRVQGFAILRHTRREASAHCHLLMQRLELTHDLDLGQRDLVGCGVTREREVDCQFFL